MNTDRPCTCHPDDNPPIPCARQYALRECIAAAADRAAREECAAICKGIKDTHWDSERGYGAELCEEEIRETIK
jgi:hypothetical protein